MSLMALLVWFTMGIALWHFTVFLPDRFWQGIVGAFLGATIGAVLFGLIVEESASGPQPRRTTDLGTALTAIPGVAIGLAVGLADRRSLGTGRRLSLFGAAFCGMGAGDLCRRAATPSLMTWRRDGSLSS